MVEFMFGAIGAAIVLALFLSAFQARKGLQDMSEAIDALSKEVTEAVATMTKAQALLATLAQQIGDAINDPAKLGELTRQLNTAETALHDTVTRIESGAVPLT